MTQLEQEQKLVQNLEKLGTQKFRGKQVYRKKYSGVSRKVIVKKCKICEERFLARVDRIKSRGRLTCGKSCAGKYKARQRDLEGENNPAYKGKADYVQDIKDKRSCSREGCNVSKNSVLCFHHLKEYDKEENVSTMAISSKYSLEDVEREVDKCEIVCLNCHAYIHSKESSSENKQKYEVKNFELPLDNYRKTDDKYKGKRIYIGDLEKGNQYRHIVKECKNCGQEFFARLGEVKRGYGNFHNQSCSVKYRNKKDNLNQPKKETKYGYVEELKENNSCNEEGCDESRPECLTFHHRNPEEKNATINSMLGDGSTLKELKEEVQKCDLICRNCHQLKHTK